MTYVRVKENTPSCMRRYEDTGLDIRTLQYISATRFTAGINIAQPDTASSEPPVAED
jgi:hypothetical protein